MKNYLLLLLCVVSLGIVSCDEDPPVVEDLVYAGDNANSPVLPPGIYEFAARFPASFTDDFTGQTLESVDINLYEIPAVLELRIYGAGSATAPGSVLYSEVITDNVVANSRNSIFLRDPIELTDQELWISVRASQSVEQQVMGCDAGPRDPNGDRFFASDGSNWTTFNAFASPESINWNIIGRLSD